MGAYVKQEVGTPYGGGGLCTKCRASGEKNEGGGGCAWFVLNRGVWWGTYFVLNREMWWCT